MIRYLLLFLISIFFITQICEAQDLDKDFSPTLSLRTNPISILEVDGGLMLGARYQWKKQFAVALDPTFIFLRAYHNFNSDNWGQPFGIKIRSDFRYYINKYVPGKERFFIAPELHLKYVAIHKSATFGFNCIGLQCDYYMDAVYKEIKNEIGLAIKMGTELFLDKKNIWSLEFYGGVGIKTFHKRQKNLPVGGSFITSPDNGFVFGFREGDGIPYLPGLIKIGHRIF